MKKVITARLKFIPACTLLLSLSHKSFAIDDLDVPNLTNTASRISLSNTASVNEFVLQVQVRSSTYLLLFL